MFGFKTYMLYFTKGWNKDAIVGFLRIQKGKECSPNKIGANKN